ncbi:hypothetical protein DFR56_10640 [Pseudogracilibacillus auburnensis]|uniref:Uncharacterized protein n=1 Tax=Pseudogracilibacillus auburnensis TaxID=1494959 RepID=A0A2V3VY63_9BACI|nr:hypothetical protein DFR56_10640 [Pseudogracilibacillus auburnensis]
MIEVMLHLRRTGRASVGVDTGRGALNLRSTCYK